MSRFSVQRVFLALMLGMVVLAVLGCSWEQPGETTAEGHHRHLRVLRINNQEMMSDLDRALLLDKPSRLTDKRIP